MGNWNDGQDSQQGSGFSIQWLYSTDLTVIRILYCVAMLCQVSSKPWKQKTFVSADTW